MTLVKGRNDHLHRLVEGLSRGSRHPDCLVVADMNESPATVPPTPFPVLLHRMPSSGLPLAAARNAAVRVVMATAVPPATLIFLDVDCIPAANLVAALTAELSVTDALLCPEILYLPATATEGTVTEARLRALGRSHPGRRFPPVGVRPQPNMALFWSLAFAIRQATFGRLGGFDEGFVGYGGEDTDLGFRAQALGIPLLFTGSTVAFHQYHRFSDPPLQHLENIVANANRFRARHGFWPMEGWLRAFLRRGFVVPVGPSELRVRRRPSPAELAAAICPPGRLF
jgi:hypothetical protein